MPYLKTENYHAPEEQPSFFKNKWPLLLVLGLLAVGGLFFWKNMSLPVGARSRSLPSGVDERALRDSEMLAKVARHIMLPAGENPLIGAVTNADALKREQPFFAAAENGDVVVLYQQSARAILYRPERDILVNVGPTITPSARTSPSAQAPAPLAVRPSVLTPSTTLSVNEPLKIDVRNGSRTSGVAAQFAKILASEKNLYQVASVSSAARNSFKGNTLVILTSVSPKQVEELKKKISITTIINQLPAGEKNSAADSVVILGN